MSNRSGAGAKDAKKPPIIDAFGWLEPFIAERETSSNWQTNTDIIEDLDDAEIDVFRG